MSRSDGRRDRVLHTIKIEIDQEAYERLIEQAIDERRPTPRHAGVVIRRALGLPFPVVIDSNAYELVSAGSPAIVAGR